tara:strand:- start:1266 stop:1511 length:246 start_codon:yes stop_codon:yes gene_type:complete
MLDKKISIGTLFTIATVVITCIYTQGAMVNRIESFEEEGRESRKKIQSNREKVQKVQVDVARIESKIDEGFRMMERLLIDK